MKKVSSIQNFIKRKSISIILFFFLFILIVIVIKQKNMALFHFTMEAMIVLMCFSIAMIIANTQEMSNNLWYKFIGIAFAAICIFNFGHIMMNGDMKIVSSSTINKSIQLSICEKYLESILILVCINGINKKLKNYTGIYLMIILSLIMILLVLGNIFPVCYVQGQGTTDFCIVNQHIIFVILIVSMLVYFRRRKEFSKDLSRSLLIIGICSIIYQVIFMNYNRMYDVANIIGHMFKLLSIYLMYKFIIKNTLRTPVHLLNTKLLNGYNELERINKKLDVQNFELKEARAELAKREETYNNLLEKLPVALLLRKGETILFSNSRAMQLLNAENKSEVEGRNIFDIIHPEYIEVMKKEIESTKKGILLVDSEEKIVNLDGEVIDVEISSLPMNTDGEDLVMVILRDITSRKMSEAMENELLEMRDNERLRTEFFANLSHEFRTPVNVIYSSCQMIDVYIKQSSIANIEKYNKIIKLNCYRILRMVNNLIDATKIDDGYYSINLGVYNIINIIEESVLSVSSYVESEGIELVFDTEVEEKYMLCDKDMIGRIVLNLMSNAIKYGKKPGGKIEVNIYDLETSIDISFKDNGRGIPIDKQKVIFERFTRVDKSLNRLQEGSGLGLYIVKSLVELHHGTIAIKSKEGLGTEFIINLPVKIPDNRINEENCMSNSIESSNIIDKVKIELSDIYMN